MIDLKALNFQEPPRFSQLWEQQQLAAVAAAIREHQTATAKEETRSTGRESLNKKCHDLEAALVNPAPAAQAKAAAAASLCTSQQQQQPTAPQPQIIACMPTKPMCPAYQPGFTPLQRLQLPSLQCNGDSQGCTLTTAHSMHSVLLSKAAGPATLLQQPDGAIIAERQQQLQPSQQAALQGPTHLSSSTEARSKHMLDMLQAFGSQLEALPAVVRTGAAYGAGVQQAAPELLMFFSESAAASNAKQL